MRTLIHLTSKTGPDIAGPEAETLCLIYMLLLHEYGIDHYRHISITLVGAGDDEVVTKYPGKKIAVGLRYPVPEDLALKGVDGRKRVRLDAIHAALLRVAAFEHKLDADLLEGIRRRILKNDLSFEFVCQREMRGRVQATLVVHADVTGLDYYVMAGEGGRVRFKLWIYSRSASVAQFVEDPLQLAWKDDDQLIISGRSMEEEICVLVKEGRAWSRRVDRHVRVKGARKVLMA